MLDVAAASRARRSDRICSMVRGFIQITMTGEVHQNLHETLHDPKKFEKSVLHAKLLVREFVELGKPRKAQVKGFISPIMKGFMTLEPFGSEALRCRVRRVARRASSQAGGFIIAIMNPFITFIFRKRVQRCQSEHGRTRGDAPCAGSRLRRSGWCRTVVGCQWSLRNTARPRRSPATPAPGSAFISSLGPWPSIDSRGRCEKSRVGD